jgi:hypothetical protein
MNTKRYTVMCMAIALMAPAIGRAAVLDQVNDTDLNMSYGLNAFEWQQEIVAGMSGQLMGVELCGQTGTGAPAMTVYYAAGAGWAAVPMHSTTVSAEYGSGPVWMYADFAAANIQLTAGETFVIGVVGPQHQGTSALNGTSQDKYAPGSLWLGGSLFAGSPDYDLAFRTYVIPEPVTLVLLVTGGIGVIARRRR